MAAADGAGELTTDHVGEAEHPVCGDLVRVYLELDSDGCTIRDLAWRADGCPATLAVASVARGCLRGQPLENAASLLSGQLSKLGGLARHERHAEGMFLRALRAAAGAPAVD